MKIDIESNIKNYSAIFHKDFSFFRDIVKIRNAVFIIDKNVFLLYKDIFSKIKDENLFLFEAVENNKTFNSVFNIYNFLIQKSVKRNITIVSIGGGITQDVTGFVASTLYRGVNWIFIPTTFLAITDSCIGSKTSINYEKVKNIIGTFYPPAEIHIVVDFIKTLKKLDFYSGIGETIKFQLMEETYPKDFKKVIETVKKIVEDDSTRFNAVVDNINVKLSYMKDDEFDLGRRNLLNYGHCFGHALETASNYNVPHGVAVTVGIIFANMLSVLRGLIEEIDALYLNQNLLLPNIPLRLTKSDFNEEILIKSMKNDKKRIGKFLSVVIPIKDFKLIKVDDVTDKEFYKTTDMVKSIIFSYSHEN